jgi:hypothetical protein
MICRLVAFVGVFCIAMLIASGAYADKPPKDPKEPKSPRPGNIAIECIEFTGSNLQGRQVVEGCCPNAGPFPEYTMKVDLDFEHIHIHDDARAGYLFAKPLRIKVKGQTTYYYIVQFNTWEWNAEIIPGEGDYFFDIRCDGNDIDETNDVLTVTVVDETATVWVLHDVNPNCDPSIYPYCENPCAVGVEPNCDPSDNPTCYHPCNEEKHENVSFVMTKTTDLSYCE